MPDGSSGATKVGAAPKLHAAPLFRLSFRVTFQSTVEVPEGLRVDLTYDSSGPPIAAYSDLAFSGQLAKLLQETSLLSGHDWLFVSDVGVVTFDGTLTLSFGPK